MYSLNCYRVDEIGIFPNLKYTKFITHVLMYLDAVEIDISNKHDNCCKVKPIRSQTK